MNDINFICAIMDIDGSNLIRDTDNFNPFFIDENILFHCSFTYNSIKYEIVVRYSKEFDEYVFYLILDSSVIYYCFFEAYDDLLYYYYKDLIKKHFKGVLFFK